MHEKVAPTGSPLDNLANVIERGCAVSGVRHRDVVEGDDLVFGMLEIRNFIEVRSDG